MSSKQSRKPRSLSLTVAEAESPVDLEAFCEAFVRVILAEMQAGRPEVGPLPAAGA